MPEQRLTKARSRELHDGDVRAAAALPGPRARGAGRRARRSIERRTLSGVGSAALVGLCMCACGGASAAARHPTAPALTPARARTLQKRLEAKVAETDVAGASAAIVFPDGSMWKGAAGYADTATKRAMTSATAFSFASVTKVATAALAMRLVEQGRLALDDPILRWYPAWRGDPHATVRDLLGHTSGITDPSQAWGARTNRHPRRVVTVREYLAATPRPGPRTSWAQYSNAGFLIAGLIEDRAAGMPVAEAMRRMVLAAPGGAGLALQPDERPHGPLAHPYVYPGAFDHPVDAYDGSGFLPSRTEAGLDSTAAGLAGDVPSLALWGHALFGGHVLKAASLRQMTHFHEFTDLEGYGLGTMLDTLDGHVLWGHLGHSPGTHTELWHLPREDLTLAVAWNDDSVDHVSGFAQDLLRAALA
jgi:D-alanyl-D-alanine carboxypeptidase